MPDPQIPLQEALYLALTVPPLTLGGISIPVELHKTHSTPYVLLSQWTATPTTRATACRFWEATVLIDVVSPSQVQGHINELPALQIAAQIVDRLDEQRIGMGEGWQMQPITLSLASTITDDSRGETVDVHRYLRFRFSLDYQLGFNTIPWVNPSPPSPPTGFAYRRVALPLSS